MQWRLCSTQHAWSRSHPDNVATQQQAQECAWTHAMHPCPPCLQAPKPSAGPHKTRECLPLLLILRNRLK